MELHVIDPEPVDASVLTLLKNMTAMAEAGEISSLAVAYIYRDGRSGGEWSRMPHAAALLGANDRLGHKVNRELDG